MFRWLAFAAVTVLATRALAADLTPDQQSAICGARKTCKTTTADAGQGPGNVKLTIVDAHFDVADKPEEAPEEGCLGDPEATDAPERDGGREIWLIAGSAAPKRILALCNDGYGSAGMGEDMIEVTPNMITWDQSGGSAWRWVTTKQIRLAPLAVVKEFDCSFNNTAPGTGVATEIDRTTLQARSVGSASGHKFSDDDEIGCPDWPDGPDATLPTGPIYAGGYAVPMPKAGPDDDGLGYPEGTALGDCARELTTDGLHGFLVHGKPVDAGAAIVRVTKESEASLLIQVFDPTAAAELKSGKAKSWVGQPHLEIWVSEMANPEDNDGPNGETYVFRQFAIGLDGTTYPGVNAFATLPTVTHWAARDEAGRDVTVYRVKWEGDDRPSFGIGVVYSQAKDGKQARMVSNAQINKNKPLYLPDAWANAPEDQGIPSGSCALTAEKRLDVVKN
ncbi:hypothetical protein [Dongia sedimenti]|uniref:Secreted protein n=1 Tax=Dongia sedimenti TaxID=3064282 RepID=A0ABU0YHE9_9PROT|nr:hypothetical protein [Rhodospirillaceae bacterium R-7]